jgi:hypothetical protein
MTRFMVVHDGTPETTARAEQIRNAAAGVGIGVSTSRDPATIEAWGGDLVLCLCPAYPKLWRAPSLLVLRGLDDSACFDEAGLARLLSHDGWLVEHPFVEARLRDIVFGARKHRPYIGRWHEATAGLPVTEGWTVSRSDRPGDLLSRILTGQPTAIAEDHPYAKDFAGLIPLISTEVPPAAIGLQLTMLAAAASAAAPSAAQTAALARCQGDLSLGAQLRRLVDDLPEFLALRGYRGWQRAAGSTAPWRVAYIIRAGGRPLPFLRRAFAGLAAQGLDQLDVVLVTWRRIERLETLMAEFPQLRFTLLDRPGADRSAALWAGLSAVKDLGGHHFGLLDDDDEIMPQHLGLLRAAMERANRTAIEPRPRIFYAAALHHSPQGFAAPPWLPSPCPEIEETIRLTGFQFYDPASTVAHRHEIRPQCYLAETSLLDEEILEDPRMPIAEDAYLFKLLTERSIPRFLPEVTSIAHDHGYGQSDFAVSPGTLANLERISLRMLGRVFPNPRAFSTPATPIADQLLAPVPRRMTTTSLAGDYQPLDFRADAGRTAAFRTTGGKLEFSCIVRGESASPLTLSLCRGPDDAVLIERSTEIRALPVSGLGEAKLIVPLRDAEASGELVAKITVPGSVELALVAFRNSGEGVKVPWSDLPAARPVWLYGAGEAGRQAVAALHEAGHPRPARCFDGFKTGRFQGLEIEPPAELRPDEAAILLIASQYWRDIVRQLRARGISRLYSSYPRLDGGLLYLG